jgi:hypothetical protein
VKHVGGVILNDGGIEGGLQSRDVGIPVPRAKRNGILVRPELSCSKHRLLSDPLGIVHSVLEQAEQVGLLRLDLNFHSFVRSLLTSRAVEERQGLLPSLKDPRSGSRGTEVAPSRQPRVGHICGELDPALHGEVVVPQLTCEQRHVIMDRGDDRTGESCRICDMREVAEPFSAEQSTSRRLKNAEREIAHVEASLAAVHERLHQQLNVASCLLLKPAFKRRMKLPQMGRWQLSFNRRGDEVVCCSHRDPIQDDEARPLEVGDGLLSPRIAPVEDCTQLGRREGPGGDGEKAKQPTGIAPKRSLFPDQVVSEIDLSPGAGEDAEPEG